MSAGETRGVRKRGARPSIQQNIMLLVALILAALVLVTGWDAGEAS